MQSMIQLKPCFKEIYCDVINTLLPYAAEYYTEGESSKKFTIIIMHITVGILFSDSDAKPRVVVNNKSCLM